MAPNRHGRDAWHAPVAAPGSVNRFSRGRGRAKSASTFALKLNTSTVNINDGSNTVTWTISATNNILTLTAGTVGATTAAEQLAALQTQASVFTQIIDIGAIQAEVTALTETEDPVWNATLPVNEENGVSVKLIGVVDFGEAVSFDDSNFILFNDIIVQGRRGGFQPPC
jgi:hypothetical protein